MRTHFINRLKAFIKSLKALVLYAFYDDDEHAIDELKKSLELDPNNVPNLILLGKILMNAESYQEGIDTLKHALQYLPDNDHSTCGVLAYIAYGYGELKKLNEAVTYYTEALHRWFKDSKDSHEFTRIDVIYNLGRIYLQKAHYLDAKKIYLFGLDSHDEEARLHFGAGIACYELGEYENASSHLETTIALDPLLAKDRTMKKLRHEIKSKARNS